MPILHFHPTVSHQKQQVRILVILTNRLEVRNLLPQRSSRPSTNWAWWYTLLIPTVEKLNQEYWYEFEVSLGYIESTKPPRDTYQDPVYKNKMGGGHFEGLSQGRLPSDLLYFLLLWNNLWYTEICFHWLMKI